MKQLKPWLYFILKAHPSSSFYQVFNITHCVLLEFLSFNMAQSDNNNFKCVYGIFNTIIYHKYVKVYSST